MSNETNNDTPTADTKLSDIQAPPTTIPGILRKLGPGLIIAGSIVGSGELIATTSTGAQAGFWLLWLIIIGCVIKVFVQVELGRFTIVTGTTTMRGLNMVPGPRFGRSNWILVLWFVMFIAILGQLGGIVGGVGQALSISAPLSSYGSLHNEYRREETQLVVNRAIWANLQNQKEKDEKAAEIRSLEGRALISFNALTNAADEVAGAFESAIGNAQGALHALNAMENLSDTEPSITNEFNIFVTHILPTPEMRARLEAGAHLADLRATGAAEADITKAQAELAILDTELQAIIDKQLPSLTDVAERSERDPLRVFSENLEIFVTKRALSKPPNPSDDKIWSIILTAITVVLLVAGRYGLIEAFSTTLVGLFTLVTIVNVLYLQGQAAWAVSLGDIMDGLRFRLPPDPGDGTSPLATAFATFGIIGVGTAELIAYPYWCYEKGYAKFTGPNDGSQEWVDRAKGWLKVLRWDAWGSMFVYTFATIAFYLLGAAILGRTELDPKGPEMIRYLGVMYQPVFGEVAEILFLFGAFAVLYSTFFVANAGNARMFSDAVRTMGFISDTDKSYRKSVKIMSGVLPVLCATFFVIGFEPRAMVMTSGAIQAILLPVVGFSAIYFRRKHIDQRVAPGPLWDKFLYISAIGMLVASIAAIYLKFLAPLFK